MSDLVERLRDAVTPYRILDLADLTEAADEIERLRAERDSLNRYIAKSNELITKMTIQLSEIEIRGRKKLCSVKTAAGD